MWTEIARRQYGREDLRYASDVMDEELTVLEGFPSGPKRLGRPRTAVSRKVVNALGRSWYGPGDAPSGKIGQWPIEMVKRFNAAKRLPPAKAWGFVPLPGQRAIERSPAWSDRSRRFAKGREAAQESSRAWRPASSARLLTQQIARRQCAT